MSSFGTTFADLSSPFAVTEAGGRLIAWSLYSEWSRGLLDAELTLISTHSFISPCPCATPALSLVYLASPLFPLYCSLHLQTNDYNTHARQRGAGIPRRTRRLKVDGKGRRQTEGGEEGWSERQRGSEGETAVWKRRDRAGQRDGAAERQSRKRRQRGRCDYLSGVRVCVTEEEAH